jgi:ribosomal protein S18 acetylase RimI-like enzyme
MMFDIKKASIDDIPVIRAMASVAFPDTYKEILTSDQIDYMMEWMYSEESLRRQMSEEGHIYYVAYREGEPTGYLSIQPEGEHVYHLQKLYILPSFQGMHLGKQLFEQAIAAIKVLHPAPCQMRLNVNRQNKAIDFYRNMGMYKMAEGDFHIGKGYYMNDYIMALDI